MSSTHGGIYLRNRPACNLVYENVDDITCAHDIYSHLSWVDIAR